jgi:glutamate carboxypeptidase
VWRDVSTHSREDDVKRTLNTLFAIQLAALLPAVPAAAQGLSEEERAIADYIEANAEDAIALLERVVNINSGTMNFAGVREVGQVFDDEFAALGFRTRWVPMDSVNRAGHLFAERRGGQGRRVLLIGHLDTVFEEDSQFQQFQRVDSSTATGPGVADMKGGNIVIVLALRALQAVGALENTSVIVAFTGDEEQPGVPVEYSRHRLTEAGLRSDIALGFEGNVGGVGMATVARRGVTRWVLRVGGVAAHSSQIFHEDVGSGAIFAAARILDQFREKLEGEQHLTFNPGLIAGGTAAGLDVEQSRAAAFGKTNVIAQLAFVSGDLRTLTDLQLQSAKDRMTDIVEDALEHSDAEIEFEELYPAMEPWAGNYELMGHLSQVNLDLGYGEVTALDPGLRGAADISFVSGTVEASLAGLGVAGAGTHTSSESVDLNSISVMAKRAAILIYRLTRG